MAGLVIFFFFLSLLFHSDAIRCFDCQQVPFPHDCTRLTECKPDEYCYTEQIITASGNVFFNTGCRTMTRCSVVIVVDSLGNTSKRSTDLYICTDCCPSSFCNIRGCGVHDLLFNQRGPYCYNCNALTDPNACENVDICGQDEVCMLYSPVEFRGLPDTIYRSKCEKKITCEEMSENLSTKSCAVNCCSQDFCNNKCGICKNTSTTTAATQTTHQNIKSTERSTTKSHLQATTKGTTVTSSSHSTTTPHSAPFHCNRNGGYIRIHGNHTQLCVHVVIKHFTWEQALTFCKKEGGDLVALDTSAKALLMRYTLTNNSEYNAHSAYWIGAKGVLGKDHFHWTNHHPFMNSEADWDVDEPSNRHGNCVGMIRDTDASRPRYQWHDANCSFTRSFICERR